MKELNVRFHYERTYGNTEKSYLGFFSVNLKCVHRHFLNITGIF